jgi:aminopeptidase
VKPTARNGEERLHKLIETDDDIIRLGEVALAPDSSHISQNELLFYSILIDERAGREKLDTAISDKAALN